MLIGVKSKRWGVMANEEVRPPLSRQRVIDAGLATVEERGLPGLSMREVAARLGCEAMSLYNHVASKSDLLDGMVDAVAGHVSLPDPAASWDVALAETSRSTRGVLRANPWAAGLWLGRTPGPARLRHTEAVLETLHRSGLPQADIDRGFHALTNHVVGHAIQTATADQGDPMAAETFLAQMDRNRFPRFAEHVEWHVTGQVDPDDAFEFTLAAILEGLRRTAAGAEA
ncbi:TetR/AcrR family transcriptional regulator [Euzebya tangerina]|uniref:TetR/AcrR family transcriptional regulator n=1 Tax=Euzebya tangerina TaxID=591198 RepID=UPI0013C306BA|nr:TetR/AcrR family transcriptional regulator [Euzebya tangerina]